MKQRQTRAKTLKLKDAQDEWYAKLKANGFQDIEDVSKPDRPLKAWHSQIFCTERSRIRKLQRENYNRMIDNFINSRSINEICELIVEHGNSSIGPAKVKRILEDHRDGLSERKIAAKRRVGKKCVHLTLEKVRAWMKVA